MRRLFKILLVLIMAGYLNGAPARAASAVRASGVKVSNENLVASAQAIITGRVTGIESRWDARRNNIYTDITIALTELIKGNISSDTIVIEQVGGHVGNSAAWLTGSPQFNLNEDVLLFLNSNNDGVLHTAHLGMGKFSIITNSSSGLRSITQPGLIDNQIEAEPFIQHIKELVSLRPSANGNLQLRVSPAEYIPGTGEAQESFTLQGSRFFQPDVDAPVNFFVNPNNAPVAGGGMTEVNNAIKAWNGAGSRLKLVNAGSTSTSCGIRFDKFSTISFADCDKQIDDPINGQGVISAVMMFLGDDFRVLNGTKFRQIQEADIVFNNGFTTLLSNSKNLEEEITYDLGLAFGLSNSSVDPNEQNPTLREAIMYLFPHFDGRGARLNSDDQIGVNVIYPFFTPLSLRTTTLPSPVLTVPYTLQLLATDGFPGYKFAITDGQLPAGLSLDSNGLITGTPKNVETQLFEVTVTDMANFSVQRVYQLSSTTLAPRVDAVTPERVRYNGDSMITITGVNFLGTTAVNINLGGLVNFKVVDNNTITAQIVGPGRTGILADIRVVNPGGASILNSAIVFDGPMLVSAQLAQVKTKNSKGKPVNNRGIIVRGQGLTFNQQIKVNGNVVSLTSTRDLITGEIVYFGDTKGIVPAKGVFNVNIVDTELNSESNTVQATRRK